MNITSFNPLILTSKADETIKLFEDLGFEKRHAPSVDLGNGNVVTCTRMKNENGLYVDIADIKTMPQDMTIMRMNVDDFDEAYNLLVSHGFKKCVTEVINTSSSKFILLESPSGFIINLVQHIKD